MAQGDVGDTMFCEACGAHRDQLRLAGDDIRACPDCGRATCTNCWNQVAAGCLACRPFALPIAASAPVVVAAVDTPKAGTEPARKRRGKAVAATATAAATAARQPASRRFKRTADASPDPVVTRMPGVVESAPPVARAAEAGVLISRFGRIRLGRVVRASAVGSALAVSVTAVVFAGVVRLAPTGPGGTGAPAGVYETASPTDATPGETPTTAPAVVTPTDTRRPSRTPGGTSGAGKPDPTTGSTPKPTAAPTKTPKPTAKPTATPAPTATATSTPDPTATPVPTPAPTDTPEPPTPAPTDTPTPTP